MPKDNIGFAGWAKQNSTHGVKKCERGIRKNKRVYRNILTELRMSILRQYRLTAPTQQSVSSAPFFDSSQQFLNRERKLHKQTNESLQSNQLLENNSHKTHGLFILHNYLTHNREHHAHKQTPLHQNPVCIPQLIFCLICCA